MGTFDRNTANESSTASSADEQAVARYRYMLATAPPEDIERAHEEAFAKLTPDQRRQALESLARYVPPSEIRGDDPTSLARTATRAEVREPGTLERAWGGGTGLGGWFLTLFAASFIGTAVAEQFFDNDAGGFDQGGSADAGEAGETGEATETGWESGDSGDVGGDIGGGDIGGDLGGFDIGF